MTNTVEFNIAEALALIDEGLGTITSREVMSAGEVTNMLLDVRTLLAASVEPVAETLAEPAAVPG